MTVTVQKIDPAASAVKGTVSGAGVTLRVAEIVRETADAVSVVLEVPDALREQFVHRPGQFLTLRIPSERTGSVARCYSLANCPLTETAPKVTVKRTPDGYASHWICDQLRAGDTLEVLPPAGVFTPSTLDADLLLVAAGSGITPVMSILKAALHQGAGHVALVYANRDAASVIFADELRVLEERFGDRFALVEWREDERGLPTASTMAPLLAAFPDRDLFTCGPGPFMEVVEAASALAGLPAERFHQEHFVSLSGDPFAPVDLSGLDVDAADAPQVTVTLDGTTQTLAWPHGATLVDALLAKGARVPFSCREGECGSCAARLVRGEVDHGNAAVLDEDDFAEGLMLACQATPLSEELEVEF